MGIVAWKHRQADGDECLSETDSASGLGADAHELSSRPPALPVEPQAVSAPAPAEDKLALWDEIRKEVENCQACSLHTTRTNTVFADGTPDADWMFVGEAPGGEEDRQGVPFVGRAGQLLNAMLQALGKKREEVCIANVLKCRPPGNRDPRGEEVQKCEPFLLRQVALVRPRIIVVLGRFAAHSLLRTDEPIGKLRGRLFHYGEQKIPLVVSYHPAYLLRNPADKKKAWTDLKLALSIMENNSPG